MRAKELIANLDEEAIVRAIAQAEAATSGEIRVYISHQERKDPLHWARRRFHLLGMKQTRDRNAVLIYLVPATRQLALVGDVAVHAKCGEPFWKKACEEFAETARQQTITKAIVQTIGKVGKVLAEHFPAQPGNRNELPNHIERSPD